MKNTHLKTYFEEFNRGNTNILEQLKEITEAYGLNSQKEVLLNVSRTVVLAYFTSLGFKYRDGLLIRSVSDFDEKGEEHVRGWSCFKVTEVSKKPITAIEGVGQDAEFPNIYEIPGSDKSIEFNDAKTIAEVVLSGRNIPGTWRRLVVDNGVNVDGVKFISSALSITGDATEEVTIEINELYSAVVLGNVPKNYILIVTDASSGTSGMFDVHMLTKNSPEEDKVFVNQLKGLIHKWKTQNQK